MKTRLIFTLFLCISITIFAQKASNIGFVIKNLGINVDGHFNTFSITTTFDTANRLESLEGEITVASIETGIDSRDEHLLKDDYFNSEKYPNIILESTQINKTSLNQYTVQANLTIKGKTKEITIPISVSISDNSIKIISDFEVNRKDFNVGGGSLVMSKTVRIQVVHVEKI